MSARNIGTLVFELVKNPLDPEELKTALDKVHRAGMPGVFAEVRDGDQVWRGASGVADVGSGRPVTPDLRHRVGSLTWRTRLHDHRPNAD